ncbi:ATP-binding cassette domain-containing protein [Sedimentibacter sp. zth1]|uniref:ABC transporter ATP-binding protein n=1 Tax=Sedimentibacter sp. zth1 TaxID=2816908 RepID=UPI001A914B08|nr:oligopeptide/dipeptide ABC transporter ATP-binding protein [Sedimentibacter sp. zth1]QSX04725.1 ATP-binding cassette domain-containing protein [Sedimentibacter sp. zth1]
MKYNKTLISINNVIKTFPVKKLHMLYKEKINFKAIDNISLNISVGETVGIVGESGCGKSTFGRTILQLYKQTSGRTMYYGKTIEELHPKYIKILLKNLKTEINRYNKLLENKNKLEKQNKLSASYNHIIRLREINKKEQELLLDITNIIGGFIVADNIDYISQLFLKEYKAKLHAVKLKDIINSKNTKNIKKTIDLYNKKQLISKEMRKLINKEKEKYTQNLEFEKYENNLDNGINLAKLTSSEMRLLRRDLQVVFQDPHSSLDPRMTVGQIIGEGLLAHGIFKKNDDKMQEYIMKIMEDCGLSGYMLHRYPHQFSEGQRQRVNIARTLALKPKFVVCDEVVSALDVSIQSQIINLLLDLKEKEGLTYLFISHNLNVVKYISDKIGVMYLGNLIELCDSEELFKNPFHPYSKALIDSIPTTDGKDDNMILLEGDMPSPINPPNGCKFHTRCPHCKEICENVIPEFIEYEKNHFVACHMRGKKNDI